MTIDILLCVSIEYEDFFPILNATKLSLFFPPGFLKDINGQYENAFYVGGSSMVLGALILLTSNIRHLMLTREGQCNEEEH